MDEFAFLQGLIQGLRCGVVSVDTEGRLRLLNQPARQILGLAAVPPPGARIEQVLADYPQLVRLLRESYGMSSPPNRAEIDLESAPGARKTVGFTISLIRDAEGTAHGAAMFFKDLTRIEHKEEQERLRDRLAALGQMAASMAHEIRNPLAGIEVSCGLLRRRLGPDDRGRELVDKIVAEVRRLNQTIHSSLEFVRPLTLNLEPAELAPLLEEAIAVAAERRPGGGVKIVRRFAGEMPAFLMDRARLRQVFVNLIVNAVEAVGETGTVSVATEVVEAPREGTGAYPPARAGDPWQNFEHFAVVRIADSGPGISDEVRGRVFYPFFTTKKLGSGVGLATAKKIVDSHRGLIDVANRSSGGAVFTVRLPMIPEAEVSRA